MAFQSVPQTYGAELRFTWNGVDCENTLAFRRPGLPSQAECDALAEALSDWWWDFMRSQQSNSVVMREVYVRDLESNPFIQKAWTEHAGVTGAIVAQTEATVMTKSILFKSSLSGRSARGANRIIGLTEAQTTGRVVDPSSLGSWLAVYDEMPAYVSPYGLSHVIVSRFTEGEKRTVGITYPVTSYAVPNGLLGTARSRLT